MTMTCHVLHAGDGYTYLTDQVASFDMEREPGQSLADYYLASGTPPGQWAGSGISDLGMSGQVTEEHMRALFGEGLHPDADAMVARWIDAGMPYAKAIDRARLGRRFAPPKGGKSPLGVAVQEGYDRFAVIHDRRPSVAERREIKEKIAAEMLSGPGGTPPEPAVVRRFLVDELGKADQPVTGFDLVFTPPKSASVLWGLGKPDVAQAIEEVHEQAWRTALAYGEREAAFTRIGAGGVGQIDTNGFVAVAFQHRDSRCGDPNLHTHVVVANRVLGVDGKWRTLDSRQVHRVAVSMSETYNAAVEHGLTERLGVAWQNVPKPDGKRPVREIAGVPDELITGFSSRRNQVEKNYERLIGEYVKAYGHTPSRSVQMRLAQQATLEDRPEKATAGTTLGEQRDAWRAAAQGMLPGQDLDRTLAATMGRAAAAAEPVEVGQLAATVVDIVSQHRSTWSVYHVRSEAIRQLKPHRFATAADRERVTEEVVATALGTESIELSVALTPPPKLLQRADGESIYQRHGATRYTSTEILDAEQRLLDAARTQAGPVVAARDVHAAIAAHEARTGRALDPGQRQLVEQFVTCGKALAVGIGPPGAGKSTAMRAVRTAWETTGGRIIGLAPSAASAQVLGTELGVAADTMHRLVTLHAHGREIDLRAGDMVLVDEAGMGGTRTLDAVRAIAAERGAVIRLVGDYRQLAAVEAGGALRLIHHDHGGTELTRLHRFRDPAEATAVLQLRVGDKAAVGFYSGRGRLHGGTRTAVLDQLYADWNTDTTLGRASIMMSDSTEVVRELSGRAQTDRRATGEVEPGGVRLRDGTSAGVGDRIVTRHNQRRLALGPTDYVKNGDLWDVTARHDDGSLTVRHVRHRGEITLPAPYVATQVELGYAATVHRSQGLTVDVSRGYLTPIAVREAALVALSRGTEENHAYLDTDTILDRGEPETLPGELFYRHRNDDPAAAAMTAILRREGAELSATEHLRAALEEPFRLDVAVPAYLHALDVHRGPDAFADAETWVQQALPAYADEILLDPAWPALAEVLHQVRDTGAGPVDVLARRAAQRPFDDPADPAHSIAQVLHHRLEPDLPAATASAVVDGAGERPALLPGWIPAPPPVDPTAPRELADLQEWLAEKARDLTDRVRHLGEQTAENPPAWAAHLGPVPLDPLDRETWIHRAGQVAAYRERFGVPDDDPELLPHTTADTARDWVARHLTATEHTPLADDPADVDGHALTAAERAGLDQETVEEPVEAMWERMDRWRAEHETSYPAENTEIAEPALSSGAELLLRIRYTGLQMGLTGAHIAGDTDREQELLAQREDFIAAHPELVERIEAEKLQKMQQEREWKDAWRERPHSTLSGDDLAAAIAREQRRIEKATQARQILARRLTDLEPQVAAGAGPRVRDLDARVTALTARAELATQYDGLAREHQNAATEARIATANANDRARKADQLTRWDTLRHPGLRGRLTEEAADLREAAAQADAVAGDLRTRMNALTQQDDDPGSLHRARAEARLAVDNHDRDRQTAQAADQRDVDDLHRQTDRASHIVDNAGTTLGELRDEADLRTRMPENQHDAEDRYRSTERELQAERALRAAQQRTARQDERYDPHRYDQHYGQDRGHGMGMGR
ncbi:MobF family relaxase [Amycolatopsis roodepoortensis]|uniref:Conjugative relaxase-like TrwC/TraI family protein n=1 Tax=Amycolatopsis roodepoortensis TaxID=700274 RepID=A0ABR9LIV4_9PSEU|nr:MobF family relaxase [Amycolatopsis roodepoortensis]MBE1580410.1 conjugative relaxase-like TrwC/TraI family protein [Amycolatopsis roodepoortensis]